MKKTIVFIIPSLNVGGAEKITLNILKKIDRDSYILKLIVINYEGSLINEVPKDVEIIRLKNKRLRYSLYKISVELIKLKPDFIFTTLGYVNIAIIFIKKLLGLNSKIIVREASTPSKYLSNLPSFKASIYAFLYRTFYPKAEIIVAQCDNMKTDLVKKFGIKPDKITRIYNPVDITDILQKSEEFIPLEYDNTKINIVAVGRLVEAKGYDILLKAFRKLSKIEANIHLYIIGDGPLRDKLESLSIELGLETKVDFLGFLNNPYPYIKNSNLYVLSSKWEGFPNTLLEALVCNTKVVATNCESGPKEIIKDELYGLLADVNDAESLCNKMYEYLKIDNKSNNRAEVFGIERIIEQYQILFR